MGHVIHDVVSVKYVWRYMSYVINPILDPRIFVRTPSVCPAQGTPPEI